MLVKVLLSSRSIVPLIINGSVLPAKVFNDRAARDEAEW